MGRQILEYLQSASGMCGEFGWAGGENEQGKCGQEGGTSGMEDADDYGQKLNVCRGGNTNLSCVLRVSIDMSSVCSKAEYVRDERN
jgi:hypothetical protein